MPTVLHFFEPRYRLMLRRCLENPTPCFGMIMAPKRVGNAGAENGNEYGTMLEIRSVQMLADGRSMVETWGTYRFRILETGALDGYMVGRIERFVVFLKKNYSVAYFIAGSMIMRTSWMRIIQCHHQQKVPT
jgi:Lon protease-like protein